MVFILGGVNSEIYCTLRLGFDTFFLLWFEEGFAQVFFPQLLIGIYLHWSVRSWRHFQLEKNPETTLLDIDIHLTFHLRMPKTKLCQSCHKFQLLFFFCVFFQFPDQLSIRLSLLYDNQPWHLHYFRKRTYTAIRAQVNATGIWSLVPITDAENERETIIIYVMKDRRMHIISTHTNPFTILIIKACYWGITQMKNIPLTKICFKINM